MCFFKRFIDIFVLSMAAPAMELRPVPAGVGVFAHRGPANFASKFWSVVNDYPFAADPSDAATMTVPHHVVEGAYARLFTVDSTVSATGVQFGSRHLDVAELSLAELSLPASFDSASTGSGVAKGRYLSAN